MQHMDTYGVDRWYLGSTLEHCRCFKVYAKKTRGESISDTVDFSNEIPAPGKSLVEIAVQATAEITHVLQNASPTTSFDNIDQQQVKTFHKLTENFTSLSLPGHQRNTLVTDNESVLPSRVEPNIPPTLPRVQLAPTKVELVKLPRVKIIPPHAR